MVFSRQLTNVQLLRELVVAPRLQYVENVLISAHK
jgi:hypothetical protein